MPDQVGEYSSLLFRNDALNRKHQFPKSSPYPHDVPPFHEHKKISKEDLKKLGGAMELSKESKEEICEEMKKRNAIDYTTYTLYENDNDEDDDEEPNEDDEWVDSDDK